MIGLFSCQVACFSRERWCEGLELYLKAQIFFTGSQLFRFSITLIHHECMAKQTFFFNCSDESDLVLNFWCFCVLLHTQQNSGKAFVFIIILSMPLDYTLHFTVLYRIAAQFQMVYAFGHMFHVQKLGFPTFLPCI